jgi:hypothetical protein
MYTLVANVFINRSPEEVFAYVHDPANSPTWHAGVLAAEWIPYGKPEAGAIFRLVRSMLGRRVENLSQVTVWDPPRQAIRKSFRWPAVEINSIFEPLGVGTLLMVKAQAELRGALRVMEKLVGETLKRQIVSEYAALKEILEEGRSNT